MGTIELDLDDTTLDSLERLLEAKYLKGFSKESMSIWTQKEIDLTERLGGTLLNELIVEALTAAIEQ